MIDTKELRRLAQAATPGPWINHGRQPNVAGLPHSAVAAKTLLARVYSETYGDVEQETANASFITAANPAAISELLDRLEAAEKERDWNAERLEDAVEELTALRAELETERMRLAACGVVALSNTPDSAKQARDMLPEYWSASCGDVARMVDENISLRARIEAMEKQEPVAWLHESRRDSDVVTSAVKHVWGKVAVGSLAAYSIPLYLAPGAQPAPIEQDTSVRKAWARFSNELHRSPDAPYPGMSAAFEQHFSQSFTDREWRAESATWAAAWKAAKNHGAQAHPAPSVPDSWPVYADPFAYVIQHLNSNPYPLTKGETITFIKELRALYNAGPEAKP